VPVTLAAQLVWARLYEGGGPELGKEALLDAIATNLMVNGEIYEFDRDPARGVRKLARSEVEGGMFRGGGKELCFADGRPARRLLAVPAESVSATIEALRKERPGD
jgi:hypothetical protein